MRLRHTMIICASAFTLPAFATSGFSPVAGEPGVTTHAMPSVNSRADVSAELQAWHRSAVTADGWRDVGGEAGWVYEGLRSGRVRAEVAGEVVSAGAGLSRSDHQGGMPLHQHR